MDKSAVCPTGVKCIKVEYDDGTEKTITRGMVFEVYNKGDSVFVSPESAGAKEDEIAVLAIVARIAKEAGICEEFISAIEEVE